MLDVVIVGAGAAGIAAAHRLRASGIESIIVEASDRIGGRAFTECETFGIPFDHGCAWLQGPLILPYIELASTTGFTLIDHSNPPAVLFSEGQRIRAEDSDAYDQAAEHLAIALGASTDDAAATASVDLADPWVAAAATWLGPMDHGVDFAELSIADIDVYGDYAVNALVREGLGALVERFATGLPIRTGVVVTGVDWSGPGVNVHTNQGAIRARAVILTVSTGVVAAGHIRFTPDLPPDIRQSFEDLPMGLLTKIALQIDDVRFGLPENAFLTRAINEPLPARAAFFLSFPTGSDLCIGFVGGSLAWEIERIGEAAAIAFATDQLAQMLGNDVRRQVRKGKMTNWGSNQLTRGAYSAARPGRHQARTALLQPLGDRVFFAGEALGGAYPALLSGAHLSGEAAARSVMAALPDLGYK
jgi:monoamine oxidase